MPNTHSIGDRTEAIVLAHLLRSYETVLIPFGNGRRYDLVVDDGGRFLRVQCKTGSYRDGTIVFNTASSQYQGGGGRSYRGRRSYRGEVDYFAVYCPPLDRTYLVPVEDVGASHGCLRVDAPKNQQQKAIRWANDYELRPAEEVKPD